MNLGDQVDGELCTSLDVCDRKISGKAVTGHVKGRFLILLFH